jgi:hypothetical protein
MTPSICVISAIACAAIAAGKGRSPVGWFFIGLIFPILGIVLAVVTSERNNRWRWEHVQYPPRPLRQHVPMPPPIPRPEPAAAAEPPPSQPAWYYESDGQANGPVTAIELRELLARRQIAPNTLVWHHLLPGWGPVSRFPSLRQA